MDTIKNDRSGPQCSSKSTTRGFLVVFQKQESVSRSTHAGYNITSLYFLTSGGNNAGLELVRKCSWVVTEQDGITVEGLTKERWAYKI